MQIPTTFIGVDVSKATLEVSSAGCAPHTLANESQPIEHWVARLPAGVAVAVESTGCHHQLLVACCLRAGVPVYVLNARDVYFYAKALGARAKTDRLDCEVIAQYLAERFRDLHPCVATRQSLSEAEGLLRQRAVIVAKRAALRQALKGCTVPEAVRELEQGFEAAVRGLDQRIQQLIDCDEQLRQGQALLRTITGFGAQASALLAVLLSRMEFATSDALVAYSGLDPRANDSGSKRGRRTLSKRGSPELRRTVFLVAFAACHSKALKPTYEAMKARGLKTTEALIVLGRKLLRAAFAIWKTQMPFDSTRLGSPRPA